MFGPLLNAVRDEASGDRALASVVALSNFHRIQSSPGYAAAAAWLAEALQGYGLTPQIENVPADGRTRFAGALMPQGWSCAHAQASVIGPNGREPLCDFTREPLSLIQRSTPVRGRFPLVAIEDGTSPNDYTGLDVRGAIVLTAGPVQRVHARAVIERGAAGLLAYGRRLAPPVRTDLHDRDSLAYTSFWWSEREARGWGFVVSPQRADALRARLAQGDRIELDVAIDSAFADASFPIVSARIPAASADGPARDVLVLSHLCHPQPGANDNGSGVAATLETARTLMALQARGLWRPAERGVRFLWMPEWNGTLAWLAGDAQRAGTLSAAINLDMVGEDQGQCGSTLLLEHPPHFLGTFAEPLLERIRHDAQDWVSGFSGPGHYSLTRIAEVPYSGGSDHAVLIHPAFGVPCPMLIQWPDRFYHSSYDTPDRCDPASLALAVRCAATYAGFLAAAGPAECEWLAAMVTRRARVRLLAACDAQDAAFACERERLRTHAALESLGRLGIAPPRLQTLRDRIDQFAATETPARNQLLEDALATPAMPWAALRKSRSLDAVPTRVLDAPLDLMRHLTPGFDGLPEASREVWRALDRDTPGGTTALEVAWYACDGVRDLAAIAEAVGLECGSLSDSERALTLAASIVRFFMCTAELGLSGWKKPVA